MLECLQLHFVDICIGKHLFYYGRNFVQIGGKNETLQHRDVRTMSRIQGETFGEDFQQPGICCAGMLDHCRVGFQQDVNRRDRGLRD